MDCQNCQTPYPCDVFRERFAAAIEETKPACAKLFQTHEEITARAFEIMKAKNHDYASSADPFRNFRAFGLLGILVRLSDKMARLRSFEEQGVTKVSDESITDTVIDIVNYAVIFEAMRRESL